MATRGAPKVIPINREDTVNAELTLAIYRQACELISLATLCAKQIKDKDMREAVLESIDHVEPEITLEDLSKKKS